MLWVTFKTMALIGLCFLRKQTLLELTDSNVCGPEKISKTAAKRLPAGRDHVEHPSPGSPSSDLKCPQHLPRVRKAASIFLTIDQMGDGRMCDNEEETVKVTCAKEGVPRLRAWGERGVNRLKIIVHV